ncbi:hypothetical protein NBRC116188_11070 [Oceaniserpentilla sp. 4NH20-0058]|uniref:CDP-glycerol glycerophosphotransferase family protein n=1 Tax=Oceaniserpentilla sp. 4NH20-0058 TaxID=3127660 RepID=UPI00310AEE85
MQIFFDVQQLYYVPQYTPLQHELEGLGVKCVYVFYRDAELYPQQAKVASSLGCAIRWVEDETEAKAVYLAEKPEWVILGNYFDDLEELHRYSKTGLMSHGIGPKACYYTVSDSRPYVRFVEGPYRTKRLKSMYPESEFVDVGYAKLDPIINHQEKLTLNDLGLDNLKPTVLYAPTFYPSSIECFSKDFPSDFGDYNIILKPHYFSLANVKYKKQKKLLEHWSSFNNVYLATIDEVNILPFMYISDLLISDASSTLFEFAALNKPIIWCDFYKLRLGYRGLFKFRFEQRMDQDLYKYADISVHASGYRELKKVVQRQIANPEEFESIRKKYTAELAGLVDGKVSKRIAQYIVKKP